MRKLMLLVGVLGMLTPGAQAAVGLQAPNLRVLGDGGRLCYDALATVDGKESAAYVKAAETRLKTMLTGLGLRADELDAAESCDRILTLAFEMDNEGAPAIATVKLDLISALSLDNDQALRWAILWRDDGWSAQKGIMTKTEIDKEFDKMIGWMFTSFKEDYAARNAK